MILLTIAAVYLELKLVKHIKPLDWAIQKWALVGMLFSVWLSVEIGELFGAASAAVMTAGIVSMMVTQGIYWVKTKARYGNDKVKTQIAFVKTASKATVSTYKPVAKVAGGTVALVASPFWVPVMIHQNGVQGSIAIGKKFLAKSKANRKAA